MIKDTIQKVLNLYAARTHAYRMVFNKDNKFTMTVLKDLAKFCRAHDSTFDKDERIHAVMEGRREVWLRIEQHLSLNQTELYELHRIKTLPNGEKNARE